MLISLMMLATVNKFGLKCCELPTMIWNMSVFLRILTLNIDPRDKRGIPFLNYIITGTVIMCYFYVYLLSMIWFVFWRCSETGDVLAALIIFSLGVSSEIGTVKFFFMLFHQSKVKQIITECLACEQSVLPKSRFANNLLSTLRDVKKRALSLWLVIMGNGVVYILIPVFTPGRHIMDDRFIFYGLEPMFETPNYQIAFLLSAAGIIFGCYSPANIQAFFIIISGYVEAQMLALTEEMIHLYQDAKENYYSTTSDAFKEIEKNISEKNKIINDYIKERLKAIVRNHASNIIILKQMESVFSGAIVLEFILLTTSLIAELLGGLENTYIQLPYALMQVGTDCFTGQRVMDASAKFEAAVYNCEWEKFNKDNMKIVLVMLQNTQKTMKLSAGGVTTLSFQCFMTVIRSIYSAYTTLRSNMI